MPKYIIALDQGTTSSRAIIFDDAQNIVELSQKEFTQLYPKPGYVEHDPMEIYSSQYSVMTEVITKSGISPADIAAIGITNQRETAIVWDKRTGRPVYNAIVWQCRRTADMCENLRAEGYEKTIKAKTGLVPDAYFSATKIAWILENVSGAREKAEQGHLLFGTVDTWLMWKLSGGAVHATDYTNASRTMLYNIHTLEWDEELCAKFNIPMCMLPQVKNSSEVYCTVDIGGYNVPIAGVAGDQQAALFGQSCFEAGEAKNTYGTGCFLLFNTGSTPCESKNNLLTTIAIGLGGKVQYALEGSVFSAGSIIQWLRDELKILTTSAESEALAASVDGTGGVYIVPAFTGLGAPYWDMYARASITGITRGTNRAHIARAALAAIALQTNDLISAVEADTGLNLKTLKVDGGASANNLLMQMQADYSDIEVVRPMIRETTAMGAYYLAALAVGIFENKAHIKKQWTLDSVFTPKIAKQVRLDALNGWREAVGRTLTK